MVHNKEFHLYSNYSSLADLFPNYSQLNCITAAVFTYRHLSLTNLYKLNLRYRVPHSPLEIKNIKCNS